jgi:hypothetical protein
MDKILSVKGVKDNLPFPSKMIFNNFTTTRIEERKNKIEAYLNKLSELLNFVELTEACAFFEVEPHIKTLLSSLEFDERQVGSPSTGALSSLDFQDNDFEIVLRKAGIKVHEFIKHLNEKPLMTAKSVQEFEEYFFDKGLVLTKEEVKELLWGTPKYKGLLHLCGNVDKFVGSNSCISLFTKFIKYEYNSTEAEKFLEVFGETEPSIIKSMHLETYIKEITSMDNSGLLCLYYYLKMNSCGITDPRELLADEESAQEYEKWIQNKLTNGTNS